MPPTLDQIRLRVSRNTDAAKKARLGQFLTPTATASFMAAMFPAGEGNCRLLDAGAGIGALSAAFLKRWRDGGFGFRRVELDAFEIDPSVHDDLWRTLTGFTGSDFSFSVRSDDFVEVASDVVAGGLFGGSLPSYTHAILNPPYRKISSASPHRLALRRAGIETVNLYSAFIALAVALGAPGAQIVAIVPRSFCNGPYYRPFREFILARTALRRMHLFDSRTSAFKDDAVLQENVIISLEVGGAQGAVKITTSTDDTFSDLAANEHPFDRIVFADDPERFIHVPTSTARSSIDPSTPGLCALDELGVTVSTGPVIDFRLKEHLRAMPESGTVPLLYPGHLVAGELSWPNADLKKPNAILHNDATERWLYPTGFYCAVRRFSSKEEVRRVVAGLIDPTSLGSATLIGFENHLNVFHAGRAGLPEDLARGLMVFLNSTPVDEYFRRFNGHTQVNATDLRLLRYPSRERLIELGVQFKSVVSRSQGDIDEHVARILQ